MPEKDPSTWAMSTWLFALMWPVIGGLVNWYSKVKRGKTRVFNVIELIGEVATSGFVGITVYMVFASYGWPEGVCAAAAGVGGHMGARLLYIFERIIEDRMKKYNIPTT